MWSRRRRKKEGKEVPPPGKQQADGYPSSQPPSRPHSPPAHKAEVPQSHQRPQLAVAQVSAPVAKINPHNPSQVTHPLRPPGVAVPTAHEPVPVGVHKPAVVPHQPPVLANPNLKPTSLQVPLPTAPLSANIIDSLTVQDVSSIADGGGSLRSPPPPPPPLQSNATSSNPPTAQQLQQVIDAQRSLLSQLTQLAERKKKLQGPGAPLPSGESFTSRSHTQTFDYDNHTNKDSEKVATERLAREYFQDSW